MSKMENYSKTNIKLQGLEAFDDDDLDFIIEYVEEEDRVYLRNVFDNKDNPGQIAVMKQKKVIGYIPKRSQAMLLRYLREGKLGAVIVKKKKIEAFSNISVTITVYYEDAGGDEMLPFFPFGTSQDVCILETEKWNGDSDWEKNWYYDYINNTGLLFYKYKELYGSEANYEKIHDQIDVAFAVFVRQYLNGEIQTKADLEACPVLLSDARSKNIFFARANGYLENMDFTLLS